MKIDWIKLFAWVALLVVLFGAREFREPRQVVFAPAPPVTAAVTPEPVPAPVVLSPVVEPAKPAVTKPVTRPKKVAKPATKAAPVPATKPAIRYKKRHYAPRCAAVPAVAYHHPVEDVLYYAKNRGVSDADLARLRACITKKTG